MQGLTDEAAEKAVLGEILTNNSAYSDAAVMLTPDDFSLESNRRIYSQIVDLIESGETADLVTISSRLKDKKQLDSVGGFAYLVDLQQLIVRGRITTHCKAIRDKSKRRQLLRICELGLAAASDTADGTQDIISSLEDRLLELRGNEHGKTLYHVSEVLPEVIQQLEDEASGKTQAGFSYGLDPLDGAIGSMRPGELVVIGALPGRGKTALSAQILSANSPTIPCIDFSLEMTRWQLGKRLLAANSTVSASRIQHPQFINDGWPMLKASAREMSDWKLYLTTPRA